MSSQTIHDYLKKTVFSAWDFDTCINLIKEELKYDDETAFTYLNTLLKKDFNENATTDNWIKTWRRLITRYGKQKAADARQTNDATGPMVINKAHTQTNYIATNQTINQQQKVSPQKRQISQVLQQQKLSQQQQEVDQLQIQQSRKNIDDLFESDVSDEFEDNSTDPETFRNRIFNYAYQYFKGEKSLHLIRELNILRSKYKPKTLGEHLDLLSYELLSKSMDSNEKNALKLSISRIIPMYGPTTEIFDKFFEEKEGIKKEYEKSKLKEVELPVGMSPNMNSAYDKIASKFGHLNANRIRAIVALEKANLLTEETFDKELLQMLDILDYLLLNMTRALEHKSEHTAYRKAASILDIIFNDTEFLMKDGENSSNVTKDARMFNMSLYDDKDDKKNVTGRKIDLMMCSTGLELSSLEWKKVDTATKLIEEQRAKNTRVNSAILNNILNKYFETKRNDIHIIGMDWLGLVGNMFSVWKFEDVTCAKHCGDFIVPTELHSIAWFKETLNNLFIFKHHLQKLENVVEPERIRLEYQSQLNRLRPEKRSTTRHFDTQTFFTPVSKRCKSKSENNDEEDLEF